MPPGPVGADAGQSAAAEDRPVVRGEPRPLGRVRLALVLVLVVVLAGVGAVVLTSRSGDLPDWWRVEQAGLAFYGDDYRLGRDDSSVSDGVVSVAPGAVWGDRGDRGVLVTDLVAPTAATHYVSLVPDSTTCGESVPDFVECGERPTSVTIGVGPSGFVAEHAWEDRWSDDGVRHVAWSSDGSLWQEVFPSELTSVIVSTGDGVFELAPDFIGRLDEPGSIDAPWSADVDVWSAASTRSVTVVVVEAAAGLELWTLAGGEWTRRELGDVADGADLRFLLPSSLALVSSQERVFLINLISSAPDSTTGGSGLFPVAWSTGDGDTWATTEMPSAAAAAMPERRMSHVGPDWISIVNRPSSSRGPFQCFGSSHRCETIPSFVSHIGNEGFAVEFTSTRAPSYRSERDIVVAVTSSLETLKVIAGLNNGQSDLVRIAADEYDMTGWFDLDWEQPALMVEEIGEEFVPFGAFWNGTAFEPGFAGADRFVPREVLDEDVLSLTSFYVRRDGPSVFTLATYPDQTVVGTFDLEVDGS